MNFASLYFDKYIHYPAFYPGTPHPDTDIIVVIPCYNDEHIFQTLNSLTAAFPTKHHIEIIIVVNDSAETPEDIIKVNNDTFSKLQELSREHHPEHISILPIRIKNAPKKQAGVGHARKTGMDEAIYHFSLLDRPQGIIVSLDADCIVSPDYFLQIEKHFNSTDNKSGAYTLQFQHNYQDQSIDIKEKNACRLYEIYLRYFRLALKTTGFPYCFHTIGSCFAVNALAYTKTGGMPQRQGGEDFYFLHKAAQLTTVGTINRLLVYPSPRISERVPFGTGPSVKQIAHDGKYLVYNFNLFLILKKFFELCSNFFHTQEIETIKIPSEIINFTGEDKIKEIILECKNNSKEESSFSKRFFSKFNALFIIKFLKSFDENSIYPPMDVLEASSELLKDYGITLKSHHPEEIYKHLFQLDLKHI